MRMIPRISRLVAIVMLLALGLVAGPPAPSVAAIDCATFGPGVNLRGCDLSGVNLAGLDLSNANLRGAILKDANLAGTNLTGANLRGADLRGAILTGAILTGANLHQATIHVGALDGVASTQGANLSVIVVLNPRASVATNYFPEFGGCLTRLDGSGFAPDTEYRVQLVVDGVKGQVRSVHTNGSGVFSADYDFEPTHQVIPFISIVTIDVYTLSNPSHPLVSSSAANCGAPV